MTSHHLKNTYPELRVLHGGKGKKYYALSKSFWKFIQKQLKDKRFRTKSDLSKYISKITDNKISQRAIQGWLSGVRKPIIVENFNTTRHSGNGCKHGFSYFCPLCNLNRIKIEGCPVPSFWVTHPKGNAYVYDKYWNELKHHLDNSHKYGLLTSSLYNKIDINERGIRSWKTNKNLPIIYEKDVFSFSKHNLYFLGLFLSDGHLRNNGSDFSFTYQVGSSDIFQGYWYPQFIQRVFPIFKNKKKISNTYVVLDKKSNKTVFKTNISSVSPVFMNKLKEKDLVQKINKSLTSGYKKSIPYNFLRELDSTQEYFQGVFDGDGTYSFKPSPIIDLATSPNIDYSAFVNVLNLIPTSTMQGKRNYVSYSKSKSRYLYRIRFAPGSLNHLSENYGSKQIVQQLEFFIKAAENSIRPDKVHKFINMMKKITSRKYGEYRSCHPLQKEIRNLAIKADFKTKIKALEKQYPINNGKYQPFMPKWVESLCSKEEAWNFLFKKENLILKIKNERINSLDFSKGIPINLKLQPTL